MADASNQIVWTKAQSGEYRFTMPSGFMSDVEIYCWGGGGAKGRGGSRGGGGGYAYTTTTIEEGDEVIISVGGAAGGTTEEVTSITVYDWYLFGNFIGTYNTPPHACFPSGTKISTPDGLKNIEELQVGDQVLGFTSNDGELQPYAITEVLKYGHGEPIVEQTVIKIVHEQGELTTTINHGILTENRQSQDYYPGFCRAGELRVGDIIFLADGTPTNILEINVDKPCEHLYNLEVETAHTYVADNIRVHNATFFGGGPTGGTTFLGTTPTSYSAGVWGTMGGGGPWHPTSFISTPRTILTKYSVTAGRVGGSGLNDGRFWGGDAGNARDEDGDTGWGGGGGGASAVLVNSTVVCVGAGGGGGGGYGDDGSGGNPGSPGGTFSALTANTRGGASGDGGSTGGGGGGGFRGGAAGATYGDDAGNPPAGNGGQNYGTVTEPGSGILPGGRDSLFYPKTSSGAVASLVGGEGQGGYVVLVFNAAVSLKYKEAGAWKDVPSIFYRASNEDRTLTRTYTREWNLVESTTFTVPSGVTSITATVLGGGGGAGGSHCGCENPGSHRGGAGGGGQRLTQSIPVSEGQVLTVTVGDGGAGGAGQTDGTPGQNSVFGTITALGGGAGTGGRRVGSPGTDYGGGNGGSPNTGSCASGNSGTKGSVKISYVRSFRVTGWKRVLRIWHKVNGVWKEVRSAASDSLRIEKY